MDEIPPNSFTFIRFFIASFCILPFFIATKPKLTKRSHKVILFSLFLSLSSVLFPIGLAITTASIASMLFVVSPLIVALLSYLFLAERFNFDKWTGLIVGFIGSVLIIMLPVITNNAPFSGDILGNILVFISAACVSVYTVLSKPFQRKYSPLQLTGLFIFLTTICSFLMAIPDIQTHPNWWNNVSASSIYGLLFVAVLGTNVWYLLYQYAIKHSSPTFASMTLYLQPIATFLWALWLLGEQLTGGFLLGATLVFIGITITLRSRIKAKIKAILLT